MGVSCLAAVELARHEVWKVFDSNYESAELGLMKGRCSCHWIPAPKNFRRGIDKVVHLLRVLTEFSPTLLRKCGESSANMDQPMRIDGWPKT